jgi:hypothetical protein
MQTNDRDPPTENDRFKPAHYLVYYLQRLFIWSEWSMSNARYRHQRELTRYQRYQALPPSDLDHKQRKTRPWLRLGRSCAPLAGLDLAGGRCGMRRAIEGMRDLRAKARRRLIIACPHCQGELDIADKQIGERVYHARCNYWVLVGQHADGTRYGVKVQPPITISERRRVQR